MQKIIASFKDGNAVAYTTELYYILAAEDPDVIDLLNADTGELLYHHDFELMDSMSNLDGSATAYLFRDGDGFYAAVIGWNQADGYSFETYEAMTRRLYRDGFRFL